MFPMGRLPSCAAGVSSSLLGAEDRAPWGSGASSECRSPKGGGERALGMCPPQSPGRQAPWARPPRVQQKPPQTRFERGFSCRVSSPHQGAAFPQSAETPGGNSPWVCPGPLRSRNFRRHAPSARRLKKSETVHTVGCRPQDTASHPNPRTFVCSSGDASPSLWLR